MPNPINIKELIADREAGTGGNWKSVPAAGEFRIVYNVLGNWLATVWDEYVDDDDPSVDARRIARLPDLEAAYIEAVGVIRLIAENHKNVNPVKQARKFLGDTE